MWYFSVIFENLLRIFTRIYKWNLENNNDLKINLHCVSKLSDNLPSRKYASCLRNIHVSNDRIISNIIPSFPIIFYASLNHIFRCFKYEYSAAKKLLFILLYTSRAQISRMYLACGMF